MRRSTWTFATALTATFAGLYFAHDARADLGSATNEVACCQLTTSYALDALRGADVAGDERFFRTEAAPPNIHFLLDSSGSMQELPQLRDSDDATFFNSDPLGTGCSNTYLTSYQLAKGWNPLTETGLAAAYPIVDKGTGLGSDKGFPNLFLSSAIYSYMSWGDSDSPPVTAASKDASCKAIHPGWALLEAVAYTNCMKCLNTQGFYKKPGTTYKSDNSNNGKFVFTGNFLNFNPPKYAIARAVLKDVVANLRRVRMGWSIFNGGSGGVLMSGQNPPCNLSLAEGSSFDSNRASIVNAINGVSFSSSTPLGETLLNIGQYFSSDNTIYSTTYGFGTGYLNKGYANGALTSQNRSVCWGCQTNSVIIITDGQPTSDTSVPRAQLEKYNGGPVTCPGGACLALEKAASGDLLDDVAKFLFTQDLQITNPPQVKTGGLNTAGKQSLTTYGIGLGANLPILQNASKVGGGEYYEANDGDELRDRILTVVSNIQTRATSFAAASVSALQVNRTGGALLPRFRPSRSDEKPWSGFLYRFELGSELLTPVAGASCDPAKAATLLTGGAGDPNDFNQDGDCEDLFLFDAKKDPVTEDDDGNFVKLSDGVTPAVPFWEASKVLKGTGTSTTSWKRRSIWTVVDSNADGKLDSNDQPIAFDESNANKLRPYFGLPNNANACQDLSDRLGSAPMTGDQCAALIIRAYRGADVFNGDPALRDYDRENLLADIFHSSPTMVEPPASKFLCGFGTACVESLYSTTLSPLKNTYGPDAKRDAYDEMLAQRGKRDKIALVGSNGGMLHAFASGKRVGVDAETGLDTYDTGTGQELWAFVPPDQLPKLMLGLDRHGYYVDGTAMVREVWLDGVGTDAVKGDRTKQWSEYRTVAVVGENQGGSQYFALDLTELIPNGGAGRPPSAKGDFLWMWPQPCDALALKVGESVTNFAPKPPPIGPVALEDPSGKFKVGGATPSEERWIAFLSGGHDKYLARGRGMAMVDLATGGTLWSFFQDDGKPNSTLLKFPFSASASMLDLGNSTGPKDDSDLLFDTATLADYGGTVWTVRFWQPGHIGAGGQVDNWFAARAFQISSATTAREPFSYMTSNTLQPDTGFVRTFVGSGDRRNLTDKDGPTCRLSNPSGCARSGCTVRNTVTVERESTAAISAVANYTDKNLTTGTTATAAGGNSCASVKLRLTWDYDSKNGCSNDYAGSLEQTCGGASAATWTCSTTKNDWVVTATSNSTVPAQSPNRFYGFYSYGGTNPKRRFNTAVEAAAYDLGWGASTRPMNDTDLLDVSSSTVSASGVASVEAGAADNGWYVAYGPGRPDEKTGTGSTILDGCVVWNSFEPVAGGSSICATAGANTARLYQGSFVGGVPNCVKSLSLARFAERSVVAVPGEPAPQRTVLNGIGSTGIVTLEAGSSTGEAVSEQKELVQSVFQLEVDKATHDCRHEGKGCK